MSANSMSNTNSPQSPWIVKRYTPEHKQRILDSIRDVFQEAIEEGADLWDVTIEDLTHRLNAAGHTGVMGQPLSTGTVCRFVKRVRKDVLRANNKKSKVAAAKTHKAQAAKETLPATVVAILGDADLSDSKKVRLLRAYANL